MSGQDYEATWLDDEIKGIKDEIAEALDSLAFPDFDRHMEIAMLAFTKLVATSYRVFIQSDGI